MFAAMPDNALDGPAEEIKAKRIVVFGFEEAEFDGPLDNGVIGVGRDQESRARLRDFVNLSRFQDRFRRPEPCRQTAAQ